MGQHPNRQPPVATGVIREAGGEFVVAVTVAPDWLHVDDLSVTTDIAEGIELPAVELDAHIFRCKLSQLHGGLHFDLCTDSDLGF